MMQFMDDGVIFVCLSWCNSWTMAWYSSV